MGECEEAYGFLPCSTSLGGTLSLMVAYGYILLIGANQLSEGSELLLEILNPGIIGGLVLPVLGALPDTLIVIFSGLGVSKEEAAEQVAVGVGTLAGSTIMLLTIASGGSLLLGRCDISPSGKAIDRKLTRPRDWVHTGITTDRATMFNAILMVASCLLYLSVQVPTLMGLPYDPPAALVGSIICLVMLAAYCVYQVASPELQRRKMERAHKVRMRQLRAAHALMGMQGKAFGNMFDEDGKFKTGMLEKLFTTFDADGNGMIDRDEMRAFVLGLALPNEEDVSTIEDDVEYWWKQFDSNASGQITKEEFIAELERWIRAKSGMEEQGDAGVNEVVVEQHDNEVQLLETNGSADDDAESVKEPMTTRQIVVAAVTKLLIGTTICALFSDPMVDAVSAFSKASQIPAFFVGFVVTPFASNSSELVSSLQFASKKRSKNISLTLSQVYGAVTMNNTLVLGVFLLVVWYQGLSWTYTSEVLVIVVTTLMVGVLGMTKQTWRSWYAFALLALYPLSIVVVYFLDFVLKLDG